MSKKRTIGLGVIFFTALMLLPALGHSAEPAAFPVVIQANSLSQGLAHYTLGLMYDWMGDPEAAIAEFEAAALADPESFAVSLRLGADYARVGKLAEAVDKLKLAAQANPEDLQAHYILALIYSTKKEFDKAAAEYEFILKQFSTADPQNVQIYDYLGQLYYSQKKYDKAIEQFRIILKLEPKNEEVMYLLGSLYLEVNDQDKAIEQFRNAITANPEHEASLNSLGYIYAEAGTHLDDALDLIQRALKISPDNGAYLDSLGWVYFKKGMLSEALEFLKKADTLVKDPVIYEHLGDVYYHMNNIEDAKKYWGLSLQLSPNQNQIIKKLNSLVNQQAAK